MASPGNQNQPGPSFDMNKFFKPTTTTPNPNSPTASAAAASAVVTNPNNNILPSAPFPPPSSSYPPPSGGPFSYPPQTTNTSPFHHHHLLQQQQQQQQQQQFHHHQQQQQFHHHNLPLYSQDPPPTSLPISNLQHQQRSVSYPTPPLQPPSPSHSQFPPPQNPGNHGARLMALLSAPPPPSSSSNLLELPSQNLIPMPPPPSSGVSEFLNVSTLPSIPMVMPPNVNSAAAAMAQSGVMRMQSSKLPKGRHLIGDRVSYDIDVRLQGEVQPQLEVTPITKYQSDPQLVVGRQIAVNGTYICYGLKMGSIRVLNINTALRSLLKGHSQRVSDMAFFAEDVHLLASASVDGRFYVWKISEGADDEDKPQITGNIVIAIQIVGEGNVAHPRICWHSHKQEILVIAIGKRVLRIDTTKVGKGEVYSAEEPIRCSIDKLIDGVQYVGHHDGEVTDLSMCQWMTTRLVSASTDGTIKIWEDRKAQPLLVLRPHNGDPVNSATFLTAPQRPDHIILITAGPLNRQVKFWASAGEEGWLLPSDAESWHCTQTLDFKSSGESRVEEAFFNQVVALSQAGLLLFANAKKNAIYAVHIEYGPNPAATRMDYIAEFTVTMPILSFTGTSELLPNGEHIVQVYCVQTQAIQQYALDLAQCLPPPLDNTGLEKSDSTVSLEAANAEAYATLEPSGSFAAEVPSVTPTSKPTIQEGSSEGAPGVRVLASSASTETTAVQAFLTPNMELRPDALTAVTTNTDIGCVASPPLPLSPRLSGKLSGFRSPSNSYDPGHPLSDHGGDQPIIEYAVDRQVDNIHATFSDTPSADDNSRNDEKKVSQDDVSSVRNPPVIFKHPTHLITPSEILKASETTSANGSKSEGEGAIQDVIVNSDMGNPEVEVKVVGEAGSAQNSESGSRVSPVNLVAENKDKIFCSQVSDLGIEMARECCAISSETYIVEEARQVDVANVTESVSHTVNVGEKEVHGCTKDVSGKVADSAIPTTVQQSPTPTTRGKKQKGKNTQLSGPSSPSPSVFNSTDSSGEPGVSSSIPSLEAAFPQIPAMQDTLNQLMTMQKEMLKQMTMMVAVPVTKEGRRLEAALGRSMEKAVKANADALWARFQEENAKNEKLARDRAQQLTSLITNFMTKDLPAMLEKTLKKEVAAVGPAVAHLISPAVEKSVSSAIVESFQKGVGDKAVNQLERSVNSKLEASVGRQIQAQFQTSGKQALQDALKSGLEASVIPAFEKSCKVMFEQVDATFQKGMVEHTSAAQQHFESTHSGLALALRDAINSASSVTQTLSGELADGHRKLLALAAAGANSNTVNPLVTQLSNGPLSGLHEKVEVPLDPTKELSRLIAERKYEEAFTAALQRSDVYIVSWLCLQVDLHRILSLVPIPLSQGVLLSLLQQLACDINKDTPRKLGWMTDVAVAINPTDPMIAVHVRPIFEQVYQILNHHRSLPTVDGSELASIRLVMHVINSVLATCK